jgi:hypothetical protein
MQLSTRNDKRITINLSKHIFPFLLDPRVSCYSCGARLHLVDVVLNKENNVETFLGWIANYLDSWQVPKLVLHPGENFFTFTLYDSITFLPLLLRLSCVACSMLMFLSSHVLPPVPHLINIQF